MRITLAAWLIIAAISVWVSSDPVGIRAGWWDRSRCTGYTGVHDGALLVSEDGNGTIWQVAYRSVP